MAKISLFPVWGAFDNFKNSGYFLQDGGTDQSAVVLNHCAEDRRDQNRNVAVITDINMERNTKQACRSNLMKHRWTLKT